jgi:hypothetical protein
MKPQLSNPLQLVAVAGFLALATGCNTVSNMGDRAQAITATGNASLQVAFTSPQMFAKETRRGFSISAIDGQRLKVIYVGDVHGLKPGEHEVEVLAQIQRKALAAILVDAGVARVKFVAEAGKQYVADGRFEGQGATVWISELTTKKQVSDSQTVTFSTSETPIQIVVPIPVN